MCAAPLSLRAIRLQVRRRLWITNPNGKWQTRCYSRWAPRQYSGRAITPIAQNRLVTTKEQPIGDASRRLLLFCRELRSSRNQFDADALKQAKTRKPKQYRIAKDAKPCPLVVTIRTYDGPYTNAVLRDN